MFQCEGEYILINGVGQQRKNSGASKAYTLLEGYYASMGGYKANVSRGEAAAVAIKDRREVMTLTTKSIVALAEQGIFLDSDRDLIKDRASSDRIAKSFIILQFLWFIVQV